jgi:short chain dehydrogenase
MTITPNLDGKVALITGASRGIGAAVAIALAEAGAAVAVNYRERADAAGALVADLNKAGHRALAVAADVSQNEAVTGMVGRISAELGPIDILVNNAGIAIVRGVDDLSEDDFDRTMSVNLKSVYLCTQAVVPAMRARKWGRIVNLLRRGTRGRRDRATLQCLQSRHGRPDPGLCGATDQGRHHRQRGRTVADRNRHDERTLRPRRAHSARPIRAAGGGGAGGDDGARQ